MLMAVICWIELGLIASFIAGKFVNQGGNDVLLNIVLGIAGALVGGRFFNAFEPSGATGFNGWSLLVAFIAACAVLVARHVFQRTLSDTRTAGVWHVERPFIRRE